MVERCAGPGSAIDLPGETVPEVHMRAVDPDLACSGTWLADEYLAPTWTRQIGEGWAASWQIVAHPEGGVVMAESGRLSRFDGAGELAWSRSGLDSDASGHVLRIDEQGRIFAVARLDKYAELLVFDAQGVPLDSFSLGEFGWSGDAHFSLWEGDLIFAGFDLAGAVLMRVTPSGEITSVHALELPVFTPFVQIDGQGTLFYGKGPSRLLTNDGHSIAELDESAKIDGNWFDAYRYVAGRESGFLLAQSPTGQASVRAIDSSGETIWFGQRMRGEFNGWANAIVSTPDGGGVMVGSETFDNRLDGYDAFITFEQPLIVGFDAQGDLRWADRIAVGGQAHNVVVGPAGEVYVVGRAEFRGSEGAKGLRPISWMRRYDPPPG